MRVLHITLPYCPNIFQKTLLRISSTEFVRLALYNACFSLNICKANEDCVSARLLQGSAVNEEATLP